MQEFIVWDKRSNSFNDDLMLDKDGHCFGLCGLENEIVYLKTEDYTVHKNIGKTDIDGNKIYADSSIVEFDTIEGCVCDILEVVCECKYIKKIGYFTYNKDRASYEIKSPMTDGFNQMFLLFRDRISNIKVIGTLQENPELLGETK